MLSDNIVKIFTFDKKSLVSFVYFEDLRGYIEQAFLI